MKSKYKFLMFLAVVAGTTLFLTAAQKNQVAEIEALNGFEEKAYKNLITFQEGDMFVYRTRPLSSNKVGQFKERANLQLKNVLTIPQSKGGKAVRYSTKDPSAFYEENTAAGLLSFNKGMKGMLEEGGRNLPSSKEANEIAENFLKESSLMPRNREELKMMHSGGIRGARPNSKTFDVLRTVSFGRMINGVPVYGAGSKIIVHVGNNGEIVGATSKWKALDAEKKQRVSKTALKTSRIAERELQQRLVKDYGEKARFDMKEVALAYYDGGKNIIQPAYFFQVQISLEGNREQQFKYIGVVPAMKESPEKIEALMTPPDGLKNIKKLSATPPKTIKSVRDKNLD